MGYFKELDYDRRLFICEQMDKQDESGKTPDFTEAEIDEFDPLVVELVYYIYKSDIRAAVKYFEDFINTHNPCEDVFCPLF